MPRRSKRNETAADQASDFNRQLEDDHKRWVAQQRWEQRQDQLREAELRGQLRAAEEAAYRGAAFAAQLTDDPGSKAGAFGRNALGRGSPSKAARRRRQWHGDAKKVLETLGVDASSDRVFDELAKLSDYEGTEDHLGTPDGTITFKTLKNTLPKLRDELRAELRQRQSQK